MKNTYEWKNLNELEKKVLEAKNNNVKAKEYIIEFFTPYIQKISKTYFIKNYDSEDIKNLLIISLLQAVKKYNYTNNFFWYVIQ